jgi:formate/nitrite transporter FocA (FNT family)
MLCGFLGLLFTEFASNAYSYTNGTPHGARVSVHVAEHLENSGMRRVVVATSALIAGLGFYTGFLYVVIFKSLLNTSFVTVVQLVD